MLSLLIQEGLVHTSPSFIFGIISFISKKNIQPGLYIENSSKGINGEKNK